MKPVHLFCLLLIPAMSVAPALAQQPRAHQGRQHREARTDQSSPRGAFQVLAFTFTTGDDDLHDSSAVTAHLTFPDGSKQDCPLHGSSAAGNDASVTWDNHSTHEAAPCHLEKPRSVADLRSVVISLDLSGLTMNAFDTGDNWNINRVLVTAYNPNSSNRLCVFDGSGNPLARMTESQFKLALTDFPNRCR